jgi:hypothetical protein
MFSIKSDYYGMLASGLCMIHCLATPFLFVAKSCASSCCESAPSWWGWIDFGFLAVSLYAIYASSKSSANSLIKYGLWSSWMALSFIIINEYATLITLSELIIYLPAVSLVALHFLNIRSCRNAACCAN